MAVYLGVNLTWPACCKDYLFAALGNPSTTESCNLQILGTDQAHCMILGEHHLVVAGIVVWSAGIPLALEGLPWMTAVPSVQAALVAVPHFGSSAGNCRHAEESPALSWVG